MRRRAIKAPAYARWPVPIILWRWLCAPVCLALRRSTRTKLLQLRSRPLSSSHVSSESATQPLVPPRLCKVVARRCGPFRRQPQAG
ncbi:hypothetical protein IWZ01DRAFT_507238 [Phyllosticta capitalensis]